MPALKPWRLTANIPKSLESLVKRRVHEEHYCSDSSYISGLVLIDLLSRVPHRITSPLLREPQWVVDLFVKAVEAEFDSPSFNPLLLENGWLEKRLSILLEQHHEHQCSKCVYRHNCAPELHG